MTADELKIAKMTNASSRKVLSTLKGFGVSARLTDDLPSGLQIDQTFERFIAIDNSPINFVRVRAGGRFDFWIHEPNLTADHLHMSMHTEAGNLAWEVNNLSDMMEDPSEFFEDGMSNSLDMEASSLLCEELNQNTSLSALTKASNIHVETQLTCGYWVSVPLGGKSNLTSTGWPGRLMRSIVDCGYFLRWLARRGWSDTIFDSPPWKDLEQSDWNGGVALAEALRKASTLTLRKA